MAAPHRASATPPVQAGADLQIGTDADVNTDSRYREELKPGQPAKGDFVGWGGLGPTAVLLEHRLGLRPDVPASRLVWDVRAWEAHGAEQMGPTAAKMD